MPLAVLRPGPPSRVARPRAAPRASPVVRLQGPPARHILIVPLVVRAPPQPAPRRRPPPPAPVILPPPVLRLAEPRPEVPARFAIVRAPTPEPAALPVPTPSYGPATSVGVAGTAGTNVTMTPADLTQEGLVFITDFEIHLFAGVW